MGTSTRHSSPPTISWRAVGTGYSSEQSPERLGSLIWRASSTNSATNIGNLLGAPIVGRCFESLIEASTPNDMLDSIVEDVISTGEVGIAVDIAKRAAVQSFFSEDRQESFVRNLLAEATNYLVSRDLPGYMHSGGRLNSVRALDSLRQSIIDSVRAKLGDEAIGPLPSDAAGWKDFISKQAEKLSA